MTHIALICLVAFVYTTTAMSQVNVYKPEITKEFRKEDSNRTSGFEILNRSIQNRALASSLASNAGEINRTVESLMESLFYSIMDQSTSSTITDTLTANASYNREVQATGIGTYVVIDRFRIGPEILKGIGDIKGLPLTFRDQNKLFVTNVSYRSDAQRKANSQTRSGWREIANNWFGGLSFLARILPPSFNPEELYDPIGYLGTPFLFPKNAEDALKMPIGTVRSYGLSGSAGVSIDLVGRTLKEAQEQLSLGDLDMTLPLGGFLEGEHQISILHTKGSEVWLAVSEIRQLGGVLNISLGKRYQIFQNLVKWWTGSIATIAPIDFEMEKVNIIQKDELYTFDLDNKDARVALQQALNGELTLARSYSMREAQADESGVHFQFRRISARDEDSARHARSFFVLQSQKRDRVGDGESTIIDNKGEYVTLEAEHAIQNRDWNVLTGAETVDVNFRFGIPVLKKVQDGKTYYKAVDSDEPNYLVANLKIIDRFHDSIDYKKSTELLRKFSHLPLDEVPAIPIYAKDLEQKFIREQAFMNPMDNAFQKNVPPTYLGRFDAYAHVYLSQETLKNIGRLEPSSFWNAYAHAFQMDEKYWALEAEEKGSGYYLNWASSFALMPLRLINLQTSFADYIYEGQRIRSALETIAKASEPLEIVGAYRRLMDTTHPAELLNTLNELAPVELPSVVGFNTDADENKSDTGDVKAAKNAFGRLNSKKIQTNVRIPTLKRNQSAEEKLAAFTPGGYQDNSLSPQLRKIDLSVRRTPPDPTPRIVATLEVSDVDSDNQNDLQAYLRFEENGPLSLGRFVLSEDVKTLKSIKTTLIGGEKRHTYEIDLNGTSGLTKSNFIDKALLDKGAFDLYLSVSNREESWGQEQKISFDVQNGLLREL